MEQPQFELAKEICSQIASVFDTAANKDFRPALDVLVEEISKTAKQSGKIFLYGAGRESLMLKAFCMRLFHLGLSAHNVFDITTPPIGPNDLLIASSGPGKLATVDTVCMIAASKTSRVLILTAQPNDEKIRNVSHTVVYLPAKTMANDSNELKKTRTLLPMGSIYEGAMLILFEMAIFKLSEILNESPDAMRARHTNLE